jgi:hypothetical protein
MPRYYFDIRRDGVTERDPDGLHLASATDARAEATTAVVEMVTDSGVDQASDFEIVVRDESGCVLFEVNAVA